MKYAVRARGWLLVALSVLAVVLVLRALGGLASFENRAADARARLLQHEVDTDIVIVGIDARSLADLPRWPWPRRYHARLLDRLADAQPRRVFIDIDFSSRADPGDDALLAESLARFDSVPLILPMFVQHATGSGSELSVTQPLEEFRRHATLAAVNFRQEADSLVRAATTSSDLGGTTIPSALSVLAAVDAPADRRVPIDFSISLASFDFVSYVDLLAGRIDPADLRDKTVLVGATALELGDMLPVPVYKFQPGVVVQALAAQTLREGAPRVMPEWLYIVALTCLAALSAFVFDKHSWRRNLLALCSSFILLVAVEFYAYASHRLMTELMPFLFVLGGTFLVATIRSLDNETLRALAYALGMKRREALLGSIVESTSDAIIYTDQLARIQMANAAAARLFDCDRAALIGAPLSRFVPILHMDPVRRDALMELRGKISEHHAISAHGREFPVEISVSPVDVQNECLYTVIVRDISVRKAQERKLQYQATHDPLTSLPNRVALTAHLEEALTRGLQGESVGLLMLDLCRFKEVNDTLGHEVGDQVLREVARRFQSASGPGFVARIGGDEFTVVVEGAKDREAITRIATALSASLRAPISAAGIAIDIGVSVGIALFPQDARDAASLLQRADVAMYVAKRRNSPCEFYDRACDRNSVRRLAMVGELRRAIAAGQLRLVYQPQVALRTGRSESVEALLRWQHPREGMVSPSEFIAVAESTDLIRPLTEWTIEQALGQAAQWYRSGFAPRIAVNLSARLLQDTDFPRLLRSLLERHRVAPQLLELEITESAMMQDTGRALRVIREINQLGVIMSVDDFGTGFSSLAYLRDLPVHALKLDKSFVLHLHERAEDRSIVNSTVRMAHELKLEVVAEGVETEWAARYLAAAGYDYAQGFCYSAALPAPGCAAWIQDFNASRRSYSAA